MGAGPEMGGSSVSRLDLGERPGLRMPKDGDEQKVGLDPRRRCRGPGGRVRDLRALAFTPQVTSAPPLLCQSEGGSWVLVGMAVRGSRELFAAVGPEEAWISQIVGEAHFLPSSGSPYWPPEGSYLCPPDMAGASGSAPAALFLLLLTPLIQG